MSISHSNNLPSEMTQTNEDFPWYLFPKLSLLKSDDNFVHRQPQIKDKISKHPTAFLGPSVN